MTAAGRIVLKQRRDLGQIIEASISLYTQNLVPLFLIASVVIPIGFASAVFQARLEDPIIAVAVTIPLGLLQVAVSLLASGALIAALADLDGGLRPDFSRSYDAVFQRFWSLLGGVLRVAFHVVLFFITIVGIPWGIQRIVRWVFVEQAVMLDGTSGRAALSYSADAVEGRWWRTFGIVLVIGLIGSVVATVVSVPFIFAPAILAGTVSAVANAALLPFFIIAQTLLYLDLKVRRDAEAAGIDPA